MYGLLRSLLFLLPPESAHRLAALVLGLLGRVVFLCRLLRRLLAVEDARLSTSAFGLGFPSPVGMAAGFDKGEGLAGALLALGFGSVEVGTITPRPQPGNERPRMFRIPERQAIVNRMGFNNAGAAKAARTYRALTFRPAPLGVNLGKNKDTPPDRAGDDYVAGLEELWDVADYFVINVSSPNTPGLRDLQAPAALLSIVPPVMAAARRRGGKPVLLKLAPDLADEDVDAISDLALAEGLAGVILANTTVRRPEVEGLAGAAQAGGLSGPPLLPRALALVARVRRRHGASLPVVGCGGVTTGEDAYRMLRAGAVLVQAYTGFVYRGPLFARRVARELLACLERDGVSGVASIVGVDTDQKSRTMTIASSPSSE